jgi:hypothetical protein
MNGFCRAGLSAVERGAGVRESAFGSLKCFAVRGQAFKRINPAAAGFVFCLSGFVLFVLFA